MKFSNVMLFALLATASLAWSQEAATQNPADQSAPKLHARKPAEKNAPATQAVTSADTTASVLSDELPNMKADLAELRAMLNVLASQESGTDPRLSAALQTNRKMWQIVIARLAEITQRMEAQQGPGKQTTSPAIK